MNISIKVDVGDKDRQKSQDENRDIIKKMIIDKKHDPNKFFEYFLQRELDDNKGQDGRIRFTCDDGTDVDLDVSRFPPQIIKQHCYDWIRKGLPELPEIYQDQKYKVNISYPSQSVVQPSDKDKDKDKDEDKKDDKPKHNLDNFMMTFLVDDKPKDQVIAKERDIPVFNAKDEKYIINPCIYDLDPQDFLRNTKPYVEKHKLMNYSRTIPNEQTVKNPQDLLTNPNQRAKVVLDRKLKQNWVFYNPMGSYQYHTYQITMGGSDQSQLRRYSDFKALRNILVQEYPLCHIPPVAPKLKGAEHYDERHLIDRAAHLQEFLNSVLQVNELRSSDYVKHFTQIYCDREFECKMKEWRKVKTNSSGFRANVMKKQQDPKLNLSLGDFQHLDDYYIEINPEQTVFSKEMRKYINDADVIYQKTTDAISNLVSSFENCASKIFAVRNCFDDQHKLNRDFNEKNEESNYIQKNVQQQETYCKQSDTFEEWSGYYVEKGKAVKHLLRHFMFSRSELSSFYELIDLRDQVQEEFYTNYFDLERQKKILFQKGYSNQWKQSPYDLNDYANKENEVALGQIHENPYNDFEKAKTVILPESQKKLKNQQLIYGHINKKFYDEWKNWMYIKSNRLIDDNIIFVDMMSESLMNENKRVTGLRNQPNTIEKMHNPKQFTESIIDGYSEEQIAQMIANHERINALHDD